MYQKIISFGLFLEIHVSGATNGAAVLFFYKSSTNYETKVRISSLSIIRAASSHIINAPPQLLCENNS